MVSGVVRVIQYCYYEASDMEKRVFEKIETLLPCILNIFLKSRDRFNERIWDFTELINLFTDCFNEVEDGGDLGYEYEREIDYFCDQVLTEEDMEIMYNISPCRIRGIRDDEQTNMDLSHEFGLRKAVGITLKLMFKWNGLLQYRFGRILNILNTNNGIRLQDEDE